MRSFPQPGLGEDAALPLGFSIWEVAAEARVAAAALTAFVVALVFGMPLIRLLSRWQVLDSPQKGDSRHLDAIHEHKKSTPTLGGLMVLVATLASTLLWARPENPAFFLPLGVMLALGVLGAVDDMVQLRTSRKGLSATAKLRAQVAVATVAASVLYVFPPAVDYVGETAGSGSLSATGLFLPFSGGVFVEMGIFFLPFAVLVTTSATNAVNLTDGLDGLAAGCSILVAVVLAALALLAAAAPASQALSIPHVRDGVELAVFAAALAGAALGFLWFNCHPAQVFMGDTGALAIGGGLGFTAILLKQELLLLLLGGVLVAEVLSVVMQVLSYKVWGKRIFLIAPLHHHFQFKKWAEARITMCFWLTGALFALGVVFAFRLHGHAR